jgi:hypothetical protein
MASNIRELWPKAGGESEKITINLGYIDLGHIDLLVRGNCSPPFRKHRNHVYQRVKHPDRQ